MKNRKDKPYFWHPTDQCWYDVLACGDLNIEGWVKILHESGFCICRLKAVTCAAQTSEGE